eukprot:gene19310-biopygen5994
MVRRHFSWLYLQKSSKVSPSKQNSDPLWCFTPGSLQIPVQSEQLLGDSWLTGLWNRPCRGTIPEKMREIDLSSGDLKEMLKADRGRDSCREHATSLTASSGLMIQLDPAWTEQPNDELRAHDPAWTEQSNDELRAHHGPAWTVL